MKSLIIGAGGFVGGHLSSYLQKQGLEVFQSFLPFEKFENTPHNVILDICDFDQVVNVIEYIKPNSIYHLAAQSSVGLSWQKPHMTLQVNCLGFVNVLEAVRALKINPRILAIGSSEEYGKTEEKDNPISEDFLPNPSNPYSISKYTQGLFAKVYHEAYGLDIISVRSFNHFGPGQSEQFVISGFCKQIAEIENGLTEPVLKVGNLDAKRDFTDVRDIVRAYFLIMTMGSSHRLYNVGSGNVYKISDILSKIIGMSNHKIEVVIDKNKFRPNDVPVIQCDNRRLIEDTTWKPQIDIDTTLEDTLAYWRKKVTSPLL